MLLVCIVSQIALSSGVNVFVSEFFAWVKIIICSNDGYFFLFIKN